MAKLDKLPQKQIIDGYKGIIDFYLWKGIPIARKWPVFRPYQFSQAQLANQQAFSYINKLWSSIDLLIKTQLTYFLRNATITAKDLYVRGYMKGLFEIMPPEYYATEETQLLNLAQLTLALKTGDLSIDAVTKYLEVAVKAIAGYANAQNRIFGFNDTYAEHISKAATGSGLLVPGSSPDEGEIWTVTSAMCYNTDPCSDPVYLYARIDTEYIPLRLTPTLPANTELPAFNPTYLAHGDYIVAFWEKSPATGLCDLTACGYKMQIT